MPASSKLVIESPISKVPYDVLQEILIQCLPRHLFDVSEPFRIVNPQPDVTVAPMLLCQICSFWRMVALTSAALWSHLSYRLKIVGLRSPPRMIPKRQFLFLSWWKKNQGSIPPFLCFDMSPWRSYRTLVENNANAEQDLVAIDLLCEYFTSAQSLECDRIYWLVIQWWFDRGHQVRHPNLHTLKCTSFDPLDKFYHLQPLILNPTRPTLRCLSMYNSMVPGSFSVPIHWSTLTHISLDKIDLTIDFWFSLIRSLPHLQWAYISIMLLTNSMAHPVEHTLPQLSTFFVKLGDPDDDWPENPFILLFTNLHLPALHTLSLSSQHFSWTDYDRGITELYSVLKSTPAVTTILLGDRFLSFENPSVERDFMALPARHRHEKPIWRHAPQLTHLQFDLISTILYTNAQAEEQLDLYIHDIFFDDSWLNLDNPECPIRIITLINSTAATSLVKSAWDSTISCIRKSVANGPDITFQITEDSPIWAASEMRREWGSRV